MRRLHLDPGIMALAADGDIEAAQSLKAVIAHLCPPMETLLDNWRGLAANITREDFQKLTQESEQLIAQLTAYGEILRDTLRDYLKTDDVNAIEINRQV